MIDGLVAPDENVKVVHTLVMCDRRRDLRSIASEVGLSFRQKCRANNGNTLAHPLLRNLRGVIQQGR